MSASHRLILVATLFATVPGLMGAKGGCAQKIQDAKEQIPDFSGNYSIVHDDTITVEVKVGAAVETYQGAQGGIIDLGDAQLNLGEVCAYEGVHCPSEAFWQDVAINQPLYGSEKADNPWLVQVINLTTGQDSYSHRVGGLVNKDGDFVLGLGIGATGALTCALLGVSVAEADFEMDALGQPTGNIVNGKVIVAYTGGCLFPAENGLAGATIKLTSTFQGVRTGAWDLPAALADTPIYNQDGEQIDSDGDALVEAPEATE